MPQLKAACLGTTRVPGSSLALSTTIFDLRLGIPVRGQAEELQFLED
jgi:hypothetical protein